MRRAQLPGSGPTPAGPGCRVLMVTISDRPGYLPRAEAVHLARQNGWLL